ncbi:hypothetical protein J1N35_000472 [Gossypium stocksii]|uniref:Uncharacterized protein n=1 Tax=Gossypium stocksii TaxID=47602 RepID=A0A9D4AL30_9ROSI|nr:hypothetical protein J1N35_000472 [Gossypium stocksii]
MLKHLIRSLAFALIDPPICHLAIKKLHNSKLEVSFIMSNLLPYTQKIEPQGKMLKQLVVFLKNYVLRMLPMKGNLNKEVMAMNAKSMLP